VTIFTDLNGKGWTIELDGLLLNDVREETGVDLADLSAGGLSAIDQDAVKLVRVMCVLCREQFAADGLTDRSFSKLIRGDALQAAFATVMGSVETFFPQTTWSEVQSAFEKQKAFNLHWTHVKPLLAKLNDPDMESMRPAVLNAMTEMMQIGDSDTLEKLTSATGPDATPQRPVVDSPESAELAPVG